MQNLEAIFFDVGATLRYVVEDKEFAAAAERELMELVGSTEEHDAFFAKLEKNWKAYRKWAKTELLDVSEMELWLQYLLPDYPAERVAPHAARLTRLWRDHDGRRVVHDGTLETLRELKRRLLPDRDPLVQGAPAQAGPGDLPAGCSLYRQCPGKLRLCWG